MADILERDAGFCSGGDDDDMEAEDGIHSPTDASEDSVDVKVQAISLRNRNKRKCAEPRKLDTDLPAKKRKIDLSVTKEVEQSSRSPFRPWSASPPAPPRDELSGRFPVSNQISLPLKNDVSDRTVELAFSKGQNELNVISIPRLPSPHYTHFTPHPQDLSKLYPTHLTNSYVAFQQEEPLSLVSKKKVRSDDKALTFFEPSIRLPKGKSYTEETSEDSSPTWALPPKEFSNSGGNRVREKGSYVTDKVKLHFLGKTNCEKKVKAKTEDHLSDNKFRIDSLLSSVRTEGSSSASTSKSSQGGQQRNYKNMTRERRIEANARERTRVHTISAAFDTLRHSIPAYSHNQKLSKLSVLRIACSYIMTLSRLAGYDYSKDQSEPDLSNCVDNVSRTIQTEGKIRKKKEE